jgi:fatty-acyl-CoA synthase
MQDWTPPWVEPLTIGDMLRRTAEKFPDRDAAVFTALDTTGQPLANLGSECCRYSYREFDAAVDRVAKALLGLGIEKGQHVAVWATNWPRWILLQYATARVGAVQVTVNPAYRATELSYVLKQSDAKAFFLIDKFRTSDYFALATEAVPELAAAKPGELSAADYPKLQHVVSMSDACGNGMQSWEDFMQLGASVSDADLQAREATLSNEDPINIQYTSGTTGFPKGAMLSHRNLVLNAYYVGDCQRFTENDRICVPVPFYHCFGCVLGVLAAAAYGAALVTPAEYFNAEATLAAIEREKATALYGVPTMFIAQLESAEFAKRDLSSLRTGIMAGSPCPIEVMKRVVDDMGASEVTIAYGLTEASPVITQTRTDDPLELRVSTVGKMIPGIEVKIIDPETGASLGDNEQGELCTRGHVVMKSYYNNSDATAAAIDDEGWLHSGDLSIRLPNGYHRITGRIKDMICRGGENIYPREIEEFFYTHPAVQDVAVVGVPDPKFVEEMAAWIKLKDDVSLTEKEIRAFCKDNLSHYKIPRYIRFVDAFPQTVTGKIQKFKIREVMIEELDLEEAETA